LVPFTKVHNGGQVADGFFGIYQTFGTMVPGQQQTSQPSATFAADVAQGTYMHVLSPATVPLAPACQSGG
jgi:hypothetical protein